jgi:hypothetical protein
MPDKAFASVDAEVVAAAPHPQHMYKLPRCLQPTSKDMEAADVDADAGEAGAAHNTNILLAVSPLPREWEVCFP